MKNRLKVFNTEGDMTIKATQEDTHIKGSQVTGENVTLEAKKDIAISATENSNTTKKTPDPPVPVLVRLLVWADCKASVRPMARLMVMSKKTKRPMKRAKSQPIKI